MLEHGVGVRAATGLHVRDVLRVLHVGNIEDPDPTQPVMAHRLCNAFTPAVKTTARAFTRYE